MKLRQNESCPIQRSLVCCDREPGSSRPFRPHDFIDPGSAIASLQ
jgi:hypothetical protein